MTSPELFNHSTINILYFKYREYFFSVGVIVVCLLIGVTVILPQILNIFARQDAVNTTRTQLDTLRQNVTTLTSVNTSELTLDLNTLNSALPQSKDFGTIVDAVTRAAVTSHVSVGDYSLQIGQLGGKVAAKDTTVQLGISVKGDPLSVAQFVRTITHQLPLADVIGVQGSQTGASVSLLFYYQPLTTVTVNTTDPIAPLSASDLTTLQTLNSFVSK